MRPDRILHWLLFPPTRERDIDEKMIVCILMHCP